MQSGYCFFVSRYCCIIGVNSAIGMYSPFSSQNFKTSVSSFEQGNCSVPSQLRAKIHSKSAVPIGFLPSILSFLTVSAVNAQTYGTVTIFQSLFYSVYDTRVNSSKNLLQAHLPRISDLLTLISVYPQIVLFSITKS